ncbi:MAG: dehydrogenase subunit [Frankiales bacterium]|nr:dehydrogenase subunit [Frankiales bacterium]
MGAGPVQVVLDAGRRYRLSVLHLGLACCAVEFVAATVSDGVAGLGGVPLAGGPAEAQVLVVAGTVTEKLAPAVLALYEAMPEPRYVLSMGSCANCGGPYWDSYSVVKGVDQLVPVDVYVPGCPPRPEAVLQGLLELQDRLDDRPPPAPWRPVVVDPLLATPTGPVGPGDLHRRLA